MTSELYLNRHGSRMVNLPVNVDNREPRMSKSTIGLRKGKESIIIVLLSDYNATQFVTWFYNQGDVTIQQGPGVYAFVLKNNTT